MRIVFATAELAPLVSVGGLAEAAGGLVAALRERGIRVDLVVPDYSGVPLVDEESVPLDVPQWAAPATARRGVIDGIGEITLVDVPGIAKPHPYTNASGAGWPDNADRFFAFSAAVASLTRSIRPDVLHCNDWHTAAALGLLDVPVPTVLTIHTLGYQGWTSGGWLGRITVRPDLFEAYGGTNPLAGAIQLADRVIAVSPTYAADILTPEGGFGLHTQLAQLGERLVGIRNGIDTGRWNPTTDPYIASPYDVDDMTGKVACRAALAAELGWDPGTKHPIIAMVTRLVDQKGVDLALEGALYARNVPFRLVLLGSGEAWMAEWATHLADQDPDHVWFYDGFDRELAHRMFAGADLLMMPSRFEPCGLAQMQAMEYGTIPVVTPVGGLLDTVIDADGDRLRGNGFVAEAVDTAGLIDALHRAVRAWKQPRRRASIQRRGMRGDWSWEGPATEHIDLYSELVGRPGQL